MFKPCPDGFSCQPGLQKCYHSPRREGEPCSAGFGCGKGLRCAAGVQKCVKKDAPPTGVLEKGAASAFGGSCPDMLLHCPTGDRFARGTKWNSGGAQCVAARPMEATLADKCPVPWNRQSPPAPIGWWTRVASQRMACSAKWEDASISLEREVSELFNDACVLHDLCYAVPTRSRGACDSEFLTNMNEVCSKPGVPGTMSREACNRAAQTVYGVVAAAAAKPYQDGEGRRKCLKGDNAACQRVEAGARSLR